MTGVNFLTKTPVAIPSARSTSRPAVSPRRLRVLMVVESAAAGTGRHVVDLAEGLIARNCEVHVAHSTVRIDDRFRRRLEELTDVRRIGIPMHREICPGDWKSYRAVRRYVREAGPFDVIHGHSSKGGALARMVGIGSGAAVFYTLHGMVMLDPSLGWARRSIYGAIETGLSLLTGSIIAVSPEEARAAVYIGLGKSRVRLVPNGLGPMVVTPRDEARRAMGVAENELVIGSVGRLVEQKAPEVLVDAFAQVARQLPHCKLALVGGGHLEPSLRAQAQRLGVNHRIIWLGECDARKYFAGFDLFALASRKEGLPYVVLEAMAVGLPVVATKDAGVEILVRPGVNGEVVPTDDRNALAETLRAMLSDDALLQRYATAAKERSSLFTVGQMVEKTLSLYHEACST